MRLLVLLFCALLALTTSAKTFTMQEVKAKKLKFWKEHAFRVKKAQDVPSVLNQPVTCENGVIVAGEVTYPCENIDFLSLIGRADLKIEREAFTDSLFEMSDIWGYLSPSGKEITLACQTNSLVFIDGTDPLNPKILGYIESHRAESFWCDVKVYKDVAYIVQDRAGGLAGQGDNNKGIQVFDLSRLEAPEVVNSNTPVKFEPDFTYTEHGAVHNVVIDNDSGFLYNVGTSGGEDCDGGLHMVDLANPLEPVFVGCAAEDGYVHDAQCLVYSGPDEKYQGHEICFGYNEDTITVYDVSDKASPEIISRITYPTATYTHQGWLNADQDFLLMNDELDEAEGEVANTRTYVVNIESLENPVFTGEFNHPVTAIDHNLYFFGDIHKRGFGGNGPLENHPALDYVYCANYASGLRVLNTKGMKLRPPQLEQAGFFDVSPTIETNEFFGAWSSYMHPSGVIAVTAIETGVFFLNFTQAFVEPDFPQPPTPPQDPTPQITPAPQPQPQTSPSTPPQTTPSTPPQTTPSSPPQTTVAPTSLTEASSVGGLPGGFAVLYIFVAIVAAMVIIYNIRVFKEPVLEYKTKNDEDALLGPPRVNSGSRGVEISHINPMYDENELSKLELK